MKSKALYFMLGIGLATIAYSIGTLTAHNNVTIMDHLQVNTLTVSDELLVRFDSDKMIPPAVKIYSDNNQRAVVEVRDHNGSTVIRSDSTTVLSPAETVAKMIRKKILANYRVEKIENGYKFTPKEGSNWKEVVITTVSETAVDDYTFSLDKKGYLLVEIKDIGIVTFKIDAALGTLQEMIE